MSDKLAFTCVIRCNIAFFESLTLLPCGMALRCSASLALQQCQIPKLLAAVTKRSLKSTVRKASALSVGGQIFLGEHAPRTPRCLTAFILEAWAPSLLQDILHPWNVPCNCYANRTKAKKIFNLTLHDFLAKIIAHYMKIHYEKSQNVNFLSYVFY